MKDVFNPSSIAESTFDQEDSSPFSKGPFNRDESYKFNTDA